MGTFAAQEKVKSGRGDKSHLVKEIATIRRCYGNAVAEERIAEQTVWYFLPMTGKD